MAATGLKRGKTGSRSINKKIPTTGTPVCGVCSAGKLTIAEPVSAGDTMTIGTKVYTFRATADADAAYEIDLGAGEAATKLNIVKTLLGTDGRTPRHPDVVCGAAFGGDDLSLTAREAGLAGESIALTETFTHISNIFDAALLGAIATGVDGTVGEHGDMFIDATYLYLCVASGKSAANWRRIAVGNAY